MSRNFFPKCMVLLVVIGFAFGIEKYMDYGEDEIPEKILADDINELYNLLMQRNALHNTVFGGIPLEHLITRKSQRSPSLRLRFGRSDSHLPMRAFLGSVDAMASSRFDK
ncbi:short neuropeptide F-like [Hylaeus anthracinus]|uniref:short neuropeptide F-like n=1 Tax=Hylaeus volcanicus TaxID=313075 RepID=UPI0023B77C0D|nr:short neuropeptide F-like [Hylaeus volcanicus]XP_054016203.1 short neuropeptide F-like [Hylaeus anthracinus]